MDENDGACSASVLILVGVGKYADESAERKSVYLPRAAKLIARSKRIARANAPKKSRSLIIYFKLEAFFKHKF